jgi:hypothetical protein
MNIINTILILLIILFLINYFTKGQIITFLKKIINKNNEIQNNNLIFPLNDKEKLKNELYNHINDCIIKNKNTTKIETNNLRIKITKDMEINLIKSLSNIFNFNNYNFTNIILNKDIHYYTNNNNDIEIEPFIFITNIYNNNKIYSISFLIDCLILNNKIFVINKLEIIKENIINNNEIFIIQPEKEKHVSFKNVESDDSLIPTIEDINL